MTDEARKPVRPLSGLILIVLILAVIVGTAAAWQSARWWFAAPLAVAFNDADTSDGAVQVRGPEVRKFITMDVHSAEAYAAEAGFDCKSLTFAQRIGVCYRELWVGICRELWSVEMTFNEENKVGQVTARKRRSCFIGS